MFFFKTHQTLQPMHLIILSGHQAIKKQGKVSLYAKKRMLVTGTITVARYSTSDLIEEQYKLSSRKQSTSPL